MLSTVSKSLRPFLLLFEFLGMLPSPHRKWYLYGLASNTIGIYLIYTRFRNRNQIKFSNYDTVEAFNDGFQMTITFVSVLSLFIETVQKRRVFALFFEFVGQVDRLLRSVDVAVEKCYTRTMRLFSVHFLVLLFGTICVETFIILSITEDVESRAYWFVNILPLMLNRVRHLQYAFHLKIVTAQLEMIVDQLKLGDSTQSVCQDRVSILRATHRYIIQEMVAFNCMFSYSLAVNLVQNFIELLSGSYWLYLEFKTPVLISSTFENWLSSQQLLSWL